MTSKVFEMGMSMLVQCFPNGKMDLANKVAMKMWYENLKDLTDENFQVAVTMAIRSSEFFPSIAKLRELATSLDHEPEIGADEALGLVMAAIRNYGYMRAVEALESLPPSVRLAVNHMGGFQVICESEDLSVLRGQMARAMGSINQRVKTQRTYGEGLMGLIDNKQEKVRIENEKAVVRIEQKENTSAKSSDDTHSEGIQLVRDILKTCLNSD